MSQTENKTTTVPLTKEEPPHTLQEKAKEVTDAIGEKMVETKDEVVDEKTQKDIQAKANAATSTVSEKMSEIRDNMIDKETQENVKVKANETSKALGEATNEIRDNLVDKETQENIKAKGEEINKTAGKKTEEAQEWIADRAVDLKKAVEPLTEDKPKEGDEFKRAVEPLTEVKPIGDEEHPTVTERVANVRSTVLGKAQDVGNVVMEKVGEVRHNVGEMMEKHKEQQQQQSKNPESKSKDASEGNQLEAAKSWITDKVDNFVESIQAPKSPAGEKHRVSKDLVEVLPNVDDEQRLHDAKEKATAKTDETVEKLEDKVEQAQDTLTKNSQQISMSQ